jgi:hypothetical protein
MSVSQVGEAQEAQVGGAAHQEVQPREVRIGLYLADLVEISGADQSFSADVFLLASWDDPDLADASAGMRTLSLDEIWRPQFVILNQRGVSPSMPEEVLVTPEGSVSYLQRFNGRFSAPMDLREFPRDRQVFGVWVVTPRRTGPQFELVPDPSVAPFRNAEFSISDWTVEDLTLEQASFRATPSGPENSGVKLSVQAKRRVSYYMIQVLIPLVAIVMMAWAVFWIAPTVVPTRVGVVVTTMLTLIAYRFMLANHVPRLSYLTRLDWFMLGATVLLVLTLFAMAGTSYLISREQEAVVKKIDRTGRVLYPLVFAVYSLVVWLG